MKVAVQIFGHLRTFEETYVSLQKNILSLYDCDVFFHTWENIEPSKKTHEASHKSNDTGRERCDLGDRDKLIKKINRYYDPKVLCVEKDRDIDASLMLQSPIASKIRSNYSAILSSFYSRYKVNQLRVNYELKNQIKYDWVVSTRPDIDLRDSLDIPYITKQYEMLGGNSDNSRFCCYPPWKMHKKSKRLSLALCTDILYFARPESADISAKIYEYLNNCHYKEIEPFFVAVEGLQCRYDYENGLEQVLVPFDCDIVRFQSRQIRYVSLLRCFLKCLSVYELLRFPWRGLKYFFRVVLEKFPCKPNA